MANIKQEHKLTAANQSSEKLLTLLEVLSVQPEPIRLQELAWQVSMNTSTVLRFLMALEKKGYVVQNGDTGKYSLTFKLCGIADNIKVHTDIRNICLPYMKNVSQYFGETVNFSVEEDMAVVYLEVVQCAWQALCTTQRIGKGAPLHCTGVGKLFLLNYSEEQIQALYEKKGFTKYTEHTLETVEQIKEQLVQIREQGYALDNEECEIGMRCVAVPIRDYTGKIVAGLSVSGPTTRMSWDNIQPKLPYLLGVSDEISRRLGVRV